MKFQKQPIELKNLPALNVQFCAAITSANSALENMRCVFKVKDSAVIYMYTVFDWLDAKIPLDTVESYSIYRLIDKN